MDDFGVGDDRVVNGKAGEINVFTSGTKTLEEKFGAFSLLFDLTKSVELFLTTTTLQSLPKMVDGTVYVSLWRLDTISDE